MIEHLARRGLQHASSGMVMLKRSTHETEVEIPQWGVGLMVALFVAFMLFLSATEYMLKDVVATLSMVETPSAAITVSTPDEPSAKGEKEGLLETAPTITLVRNKPITSSIRGTIRHLVSQGGRLARWRGFRIHAVWALAFSLTTNVIAGALPMRFPFRMVVVSGIAGALCANLHAAWTNKVVSMPSDTSFWQRVPSRQSWKMLALPAAVSAAAPYFALYTTAFADQALGFRGSFYDRMSEYAAWEWAWFAARAVILIAIAVSSTLFLTLPAIVTQVRIEASLIPDDQDTIVPFDRTFDGKVAPKHLGGTGTVGFLDAWRSFNWEARRRLVKLYVKIIAIVVAMVFFFAHALAFVMFAVMGSQLGKVVAHARRQGFVQ